MSNARNLYIPPKDWERLIELKVRLDERSPSSTVRGLVNEKMEQIKKGGKK